MDSAGTIFVTKYAKYIIFFWLIAIVISLNGAALLQDEISSDVEQLGDETEAGKGLNVRLENFNLTNAEISHTIIIDSQSANFRQAEWTNWLLGYSMYLQSTMETRDYNYVLSYPLAIQFDPEFAEGLVSIDGTATLLFLVANPDSVLTDAVDDVEFLRHDILSGIQTSINFIESLVESSTIGDIPGLLELENLEFYLTGEPASFHDSLEAAEESFRESEIISVVLAIIVLTIVFRSPLGVFIPILGLVASLFAAYSATYVLAALGLLVVGDFLPSLIAMIGIAVAVDYNLFSIARYKEEFRRRRRELILENNWNPETMKIARTASAETMNRTSGRAVIFSGTTVIIGFSSLLVLGADLTLTMAVGVSLVVMFSVLTANTLTPAILKYTGNYLDWPSRITGAKKESQINEEGENISQNNFWISWSKRIMRFPKSFLLVSLIILLPFVALSINTNLSFDQVSQLPEGTEARDGTEILANEFNLGLLTPFEIIIDTNAQNGVFDSLLLDRIGVLASEIFGFTQVSEDNEIQLSFQTISSLNVQTNANGTLSLFTLNQLNSMIQDDFSFIQRTSNYVNYNFGNTTLVVSITSNIDPGSSDAWILVDKLRTLVSQNFDDLEYDTYVSGLAAILKDSSDEMYSNAPLMILVAVVLIYLALLILFRSLLLPIIAIFTIAGSILFGLGTLVFVFQEGNLVDLLNTEQTSGISFFIPVFLFTTILGLGMDYSIFIISRIREEYDRTGNSNDAVGIGLAKTAGVIASAATVMITTFMVFAFSPMLILKSFGLAMAIAIFVDATISRVLILPAIMRIAGRWNWYIPERLNKLLPNLNIEH